MQPCDREGSFRAIITDYGLKEMESGAVAVSVRASLLELYSDGEWHPWSEFGMEAEGDVWIVKKDGGGLNDNGVRSLVQHAGWDGNIESIVNSTWVPTKCQVSVKRDEYKGSVRYKIAFINDHDRTPGAMSNISPEKAKELQTRFGGQLRAIAGNSKRTQAPTPTTGRPPLPPVNRAPTPPQAPKDPNDINGDIPF